MFDTRKNIFFRLAFLVLLIVVFLTLKNVIQTEASRRDLNLHSTMQSSHIMQWPLELNQKVFQIYVNRDDQTIIVSGEVDNVEEKMKVEEYMEMKSPSTYQIFSEIIIGNHKRF